MRNMGLLMLAFVFCLSGFALDKKATEQRYKGKYLVVLREQLAVGICGDTPDYGFRPVLVVIDGDRVEFDKKTGALKFAGVMADADRFCHNWVPEPLHQGEVLTVKRVVVQDDNFALTVDTVSPHSVTRGQGANEHESHETGRAEIHFQYAKGDYDAGVVNANKWVRPFDTLEAAAEFGKGLGNTASGAFVKEVKLGMTPAEVEAVMGLPITKADLGEKVLYKYKDMTVEFHDGKVVDVR
jgi:hypothetical protein